MLYSYVSYNFISIMIIIAIITMLYVNRDVKVPATRLFILSVFMMVILTIAAPFDVYTNVAGLPADEAARIVMARRLASAFGYALRPCIILAELLIILHDKKYKLLCAIPALINAAIYLAALFGSKAACYIDDNNQWKPGGNLRLSIYCVLVLYLLMLLIVSIKAFSIGDRRKSLILMVIFLQAVFAGLLEYHGEAGNHSNDVMALGILEYYLYLTNVHRQQLNEKLDAYVHVIEKGKTKLKTLSSQVIEALGGAVDAKDPYTNGHSRRVAEYSLKIAKELGKSEEECENVFYAAMLHDIGKIGVPNEILRKASRLTDAEFEEIRKHAEGGGQILGKISDQPWLYLGAKYHHERYDGKGYPEGKKGTEIPEVARIIAVADAYDAMTSNRSYRNAIPQHLVREELVKGIGTQFDPDFARIMIRMIDLDIEYKMKESISGAKAANSGSIRCVSIYHDCTDDIGITANKTQISFCSQPDAGIPEKESLPTLILYDSLDGKVHPGEEKNKDLLYFEYAQIRLDGVVTERNVRKSEVRVSPKGTDLGRTREGEPERGQRYRIESMRNRDHVLVRVSSEKKTFDVVLALPDTSRYAFISITGEHCEIHNIMVDSVDEKAPSDVIPRIAEEISYTRDCKEGDLPNLEIDGPRRATTAGIPISKELTISFHAMSYPTARLVWHCPYFCIFSSKNGRVDGEDYHEYLLLKMDGENWESAEQVENEVHVEQTGDFEGWKNWMEKNKQGIDCNVKLRREGNMVFLRTQNLGISLNSISTIRDGAKDLYVALTGDQCALSDIRVSNGNV